MAKYTVIVEQEVEIELDEAKFDDAFMQEFRDGFYPFYELADHVEHIAQLQARGVIDAGSYTVEFIEGYGPSKDMGIKANASVVNIQIVEGQPA